MDLWFMDPSAILLLRHGDWYKFAAAVVATVVALGLMEEASSLQPQSIIPMTQAAH